MLPLAATVVALLFPFEAGAVADNTALVATAGLLVRQLAEVLSMPGWMAEAAGAVGAVAGGGWGIPTESEAGGADGLDECGFNGWLISGFNMGGWLRLLGGGGERRGADNKE